MFEMSSEQHAQPFSLTHSGIFALRSLALALAASAALLLLGQAAAWAAAAPSLATVDAHLGAIAIPFEGNAGQLAPQVAYAAHTFYGTTFVTRDGELVHDFAAPAKAKANRTATGPAWSLVEQFLGTQSLAPRGTLSSPTHLSRFIGNRPRLWKRNIPTCDRVDLGEPWPGVRVDVGAHGANVEKIFTVAPGANPGRIEIEVHGALGLRLDAAGALIAQTGNGPVRFAAPRAYQMVGAARRSVAVSYEVEHGNAYTFHLGAYDPTRPLVIDPLIQATYLGGPVGDSAEAVVIDNAGNVIVAGSTDSLTFPGTSGGYQSAPGNVATFSDAFIASLSPDLSTLEQATYLGGSGDDGAYALAIDGSGNIIVAGLTNSNGSPGGFPGTSTGYQSSWNGVYDAFVASLTPDLTSLNNATYLGGSQYDNALAVAIDGSGNVLVAGNTSSTDFPGTTGGAQATYGTGIQDAFVASLTSDLTTLNQATYLGGSGEDNAHALTIDGNGNVIVAGTTASTDFPGTSGGAQATHGVDGGNGDAYVSSLTSDLTGLNQSTYLGGSDQDDAYALTVDGSGNILVAGDTKSGDFPGTSGGYQASLVNNYDAFIASLTPDLTTLNQTTYLGGSGQDETRALAIDGSGNVIVAGDTESSDFPGTTGGAQASSGGTSDAFVASLTPDLTNLNQATYLGGSSTDGAFALAIDGSGNIDIAGYTYSSDFPSTAAAAQPSSGGGEDAFIASLTPDLLKVLPVTQIPALSWAGLLALGALLALSGAFFARRA